MRPYLGGLAARAVGAIPVLTPRLASRFEDPAAGEVAEPPSEPAASPRSHAGALSAPRQVRRPDPGREPVRPPAEAYEPEPFAPAVAGAESPPETAEAPPDSAVGRDEEVRVAQDVRADSAVRVEGVRVHDQEAAAPPEVVRESPAPSEEARPVPRRRSTGERTTAPAPSATRATATPPKANEQPRSDAVESGAVEHAVIEAVVADRDAPPPVPVRAVRPDPAPGVDETTAPPDGDAAVPGPALPEVPAAAAREHAEPPPAATVDLGRARAVTPHAVTARERAAESEPVVHVTIGRIEIKAETPRPRLPRPEPVAPRPRPERAALDRYLERRNGTQR